MTFLRSKPSHCNTDRDEETKDPRNRAQDVRISGFDMVEPGIPVPVEAIRDESKGDDTSRTLEHRQARQSSPYPPPPAVSRHAKQEGHRRNGAEPKAEVVDIPRASPGSTEAGIFFVAPVLGLGGEAAAVVILVRDLPLFVGGWEAGNDGFANSREPVFGGNSGMQDF